MISRKGRHQAVASGAVDVTRHVPDDSNVGHQPEEAQERLLCHIVTEIVINALLADCSMDASNHRAPGKFAAPFRGMASWVCSHFGGRLRLNSITRCAIVKRRTTIRAAAANRATSVCVSCNYGIVTVRHRQSPDHSSQKDRSAPTCRCPVGQRPLTDCRLPRQPCCRAVHRRGALLHPKDPEKCRFLVGNLPGQCVTGHVRGCG